MSASRRSCWRRSLDLIRGAVAAIRALVMNETPAALPVTRVGVVCLPSTADAAFGPAVSSDLNLLPVYDKPLFYYHLATLAQFGVSNIVFVCQPGRSSFFRRAASGLSRLGFRLQFTETASSSDDVEALRQGLAEFNGDFHQVLFLRGDHLLYNLRSDSLGECSREYGRVFSQWTADPHLHDILSRSGSRWTITSQPRPPCSHMAVVGLYCLPNPEPGWLASACRSLPADCPPAARWHELCNRLLSLRRLSVEELAGAWRRVTSPASLWEASANVERLQRRQDWLVGSPELAALDGELCTSVSVMSLLSGRADEYAAIARFLIKQRGLSQPVLDV